MENKNKKGLLSSDSKPKTTDEQKEIISAINSYDEDKEIVVVDANSGAGKSSTLLMAVNENGKSRFKNGLVLSFNEKVRVENVEKFPVHIEPLTLHKLAIRYIVRPLGLRLKTNIEYSDFDTRIIKKKNISYAKKVMIDYCNSNHVGTILSFVSKVVEYNPEEIANAIKDVIIKMETGKTGIAHCVYMKLFQVYLYHEKVDIGDYDIVMLDEAGDVNQCTLSVFRSIKCKKKVAVGDVSQQINRFAGSANGLQDLIEKDNGYALVLSQSFRTSKEIASSVDNFCSKYFDNGSIDLVGIDNNIDEPKSFMYLTRTNAALYNAFIYCGRNGIYFNVSRSVSSMFSEYLFIIAGARIEYDERVKQANMNKPSKKFDRNFNDLYREYVYWHNEKRKDEPSFIKYIANTVEYSHKGKFILFMKVDKIMDAYKAAKKFENKDANLTIGTAHTNKGNESDMVFIDDSLNKSTSKAIETLYKSGSYDDEIETELFLYYVACTRARKYLLNATLLDDTSFDGSQKFKIVSDSMASFLEYAKKNKKENIKTNEKAKSNRIFLDGL